MSAYERPVAQVVGEQREIKSALAPRKIQSEVVYG